MTDFKQRETHDITIVEIFTFFTFMGIEFISRRSFYNDLQYLKYFSATLSKNISGVSNECSSNIKSHEYRPLLFCPNVRKKI